MIGERQGPPGAPVVLLYAHHDVQPENDPADWDSPPFEPVVRGERLYGRGAADDKAGIAVHVGALRALGDDLPVTVRFFIEGEEEVASGPLPELLRQYRDRLTRNESKKRKKNRHRREVVYLKAISVRHPPLLPARKYNIFSDLWEVCPAKFVQSLGLRPNYCQQMTYRPKAKTPAKAEALFRSIS